MDDIGIGGNFKGVMLCNRPTQIPGSFQAVAAGHRTSSGGPHRPPFISAVVSDSLIGLPPIRKVHEGVGAVKEKKLKHDDVTWKHKKWLQEFQEKRSKLLIAMEKKALSNEKSRASFAEKCQEMRDAIRGLRGEVGEGDKQLIAEEKERIREVIEAVNGNRHIRGKSNNNNHNNNSSSSSLSSSSSSSSHRHPSHHHQQDNNDSYMSNSSYPSDIDNNRSQSYSPDEKESGSGSGLGGSHQNVGRGGGGRRSKKSKPLWALTEEERDNNEEKQADQLLNFVDGLNFNEYIDDLEVREALRFVHQRIKTLEEKEKTIEQKQLIEDQEKQQQQEYEEIMEEDPEGIEGEDGKKPMRIVKRLKIPQYHPQDNNNNNSNNNNNDNNTSNNSALTSQILNSSSSVRHVHSSASVRALMEKEKERGGGGGGGGDRLEMIDENIEQLNNSTTIINGQSVHNGAGLGLGVVQPPTIAVTHDRLSINNRPTDPNNLPFLHRHPAV